MSVYARHTIEKYYSIRAGMPSIDLDHNNKKVGKVNKSKAQPVRFLPLLTL